VPSRRGGKVVDNNGKECLNETENSGVSGQERGGFKRGGPLPRGLKLRKPGAGQWGGNRDQKRNEQEKHS